MLLLLLEGLKNAADITIVLDERMSLPDGCEFAGRVLHVKPSLLARLRFEWRLRQLITEDNTLLCMGNLPPLFAKKGYQQVFVQNRYLVDDVPLNSFRLPVRMRLMIERWWLRSRSGQVNRFIVQTPTMQQLMLSSLGVVADILPFAASMSDNNWGCSDNKKQYDFLYVASGEPHKNHQRLIEAWVKLAGEHYFPSLCLTLDSKQFPDLCGSIRTQIEEHGLNIWMSGQLSHVEVQSLYWRSAAMIYPSLFESFGLPLIEAVMAGLPILASDMTYVSDVIRPTDQFDPLLSDAIADAVSRFSFQPASLSIDLLSSDEFLKQVFRKDGER
ncbi:MAG: glycosyltransferase [Mariprofundus sp.]|nr:glycosyltransferase [Mariprofundus sp.]